MALIGHCLRNNLDTNSAWILMGNRLARFLVATCPDAE
jgi:hypothetical protein